jgi:hypothetical protein
MPRTADFHHQVTDTQLPAAAGVVDDAIALDAAVDVFDAHAPTGDASIRGFLRPRESLAPRLLRRHHDFDLAERERQEAEILEPPAACRQGVRGGIRYPHVMGTAREGLAQQEDRERGVDQEHVFDCVVLFLATITARLLSAILGARDAPFGAIVPTRGEAGAGAGAAVGGSAGSEGPSVGTTSAAALASATPRRCANGCTDRLGASPRARSVARSTIKRTCIH